MTQDATFRILGRAALGAMLAAGSVAIGHAYAAPDGASEAAGPAGAPAAPVSNDRIAARIASLHQTLGITPAQEPLWTAFADVMRRNGEATRAALEARAKNFDTMNAVADLQSYADIAGEHSRNVQSLIGPFTALYDSFSPAQMAAADRTFRNYTNKAVSRQK